MIIGNGIIANAFKQYENDDNIIIFASGVSNSKESDDKAFDREFNLLESFKSFKDKKLIYFSTCSIFDKSLTDSKYITHKLKIEEFIQNNFEQYIIFRLPNVIGYTKNNNTFFNYFKNKILDGEEIQIQENATRYIIDIDDLSTILPSIISCLAYRKDIINVCFNNKTSVLELVKLLEKVLGFDTDKIIISGGLDYDIDNNKFMDILKSQNYMVDENYNFKTFEKHII